MERSVGKMAEEARRRERQQNKALSWLCRGMIVSLAAAVLFLLYCGTIPSRITELGENWLENEENVDWLYQNAYVLYRELYNAKNQCRAEYKDIYGMAAEDAESREESGELIISRDQVLDQVLEQVWDQLGYIFWEIDENFSVLNNVYGYVIRDRESDCYVTNLSGEELAEMLSDSSFLLTFSFDGAGNVSVGPDIIAESPAELRRMATQSPKNVMQFDVAVPDCIGRPVNCDITYMVSKEEMEKRQNRFYHLNFSVFESSGCRYELASLSSSVNYDRIRQYERLGAGSCLLLLSLLLFVLGIFLPVRTHRPWSERRLCCLPPEVLAAGGIAVLGCCYEYGMSLAVKAAEGLAGDISKNALMLAGILAVFTAYYLFAFFLGISLRPARERGILEYLRKQSLTWRLGRRVKRICRGLKEKIKAFYDYFLHLDLTGKSTKAIRRLVLGNALILSVISLTWLGGLGIVVIYSIVLYLVLKLYVSDIQKQYGILLKAVDEMAEGNLNVSIEEDLGVFEPFKPQVFKIQSGFKKAVDDEVKSQRMKAELITNVSHDLKTPLTAIITYVSLLKDPDLTEEQRREYLDTLERKALRLKVLIEDLFEVSKANSRSVTLNLMPVDIINLIKQVSFEMKDKLDEARLDVRMNLPEEKVTLSLDSQKTYRIYENLFSNVAKYALAGTRVYVSASRTDDTIVITIKNISEQELKVDVSELTERFVRGDEARNTEGSGLGLAIAKSFTELQGGKLELEVDGDLFKATTVWYV